MASAVAVVAGVLAPATPALALDLVLSPPDASTYKGEVHRLTAAFAGDERPPPGTPVRFEVHRHGTVAITEAAATDADGTASFSYGYDGLADDVIVACAGADDCGAPEATSRATARNRFIAPPALEPGYVWLFDGSPPAGWEHAGPGDVRYDDGSLVTGGGPGLLWYAGRQYEDFSLKLSFKLTAETDESGVLVRFPGPGDDPAVARDGGYEAQIYDGASGAPEKTGSIVGFKREERRSSNPIGHWNDYEIRAEGHAYTVILNGEVVNRFTGSRRLRGFVGLQNSPGSHVRFAHVRIRELGAAEGFFDTVGIADDAHKAGGQLHGDPSPFSLPAEALPSGRTVVRDGLDGVPLRMPDTTGARPNLASMKGQTLTLGAGERRAYDTLHVFGMSNGTGQGRGSATFMLSFADGSTELVTVALADAASPGAGDHVALGPIPFRYTTTAREPAALHVYRAAVPLAVPEKVLTAVTLASTTTPPAGGLYPFAQLYVMGLTFETAGGSFVAAELAPAAAPPLTKPRPSPPGWSPHGWAGPPPPARRQITVDRPRARFRVLAVRFSRGAARVRLRCSRRLRGTVALRARGRLLARRSIRCAGTRTVALRPSRKARRPVRAMLQIRLRTTGGPLRTVTRRVTLRRR